MRRLIDPALLLAAAALAFAPSSGFAQVNLPFGLGKVLNPAADAASTPARSNRAGREGDGGLLPVKPKAAVEGELKPDLLCRRFEESTDVWQKLADYGGVEAQLRMKRLLASDFQFADLTPEDKAMLKYISYTTVWVPARIESAFGKLYTSMPGKRREGGSLDRSEQAQLARAKTQTQSFKSTIADFPGDVQVLLDKDMPTGAYAQIGGMIVLSPDFLNRMDEKEPVQRLVLAHELSHLYKRHTVKEMQYRLVTSDAGFNLAKKLLSRYSPDASSNPIAMARDAVSYAASAKELFDWVRQNQVAFGVDQELEADACSVEWMKRSNLDPKTLPPALAELEAVKTETEGSYARTHPTSKQRLDNLLVAVGEKPTPTAAAAKPVQKPLPKKKAGAS